MPCSQCVRRSLTCTFPNGQLLDVASWTEPRPTTESVQGELLIHHTVPRALEVMPDVTSLPEMQHDRQASAGQVECGSIHTMSVMTESDSPHIAESINDSAATIFRDMALDHNEPTGSDFVSTGMNWWTAETPTVDNDVCAQILTYDWQPIELDPVDEIATSGGAQPTTSAISQSLQEGDLPSEGQSPPTQRSVQAEPPQPESPFAETLRHMAGDLKPLPIADATADGRYYVDGMAGRVALPGNQGPSPARASPPVFQASSDPSCRHDAGITSRSHHMSRPTTEPLRSEVVKNLYADLLSRVRENPSQTNDVNRLESFLSSGEMSDFIRAYFDRFHVIFPFVRSSEFANGTASWLLVLAVVAMGAHLTRSRSATSLHTLLSNILRSQLFSSGGSDQVSNLKVSQLSRGMIADRVPVIQARILNLILMLQSGSLQFVSDALVERACLVECCEAMDLLGTHLRTSVRAARGDDGAGTQERIQSETQLRTGLMIWVSLAIYDARQGY